MIFCIAAGITSNGSVVPEKISIGKYKIQAMTLALFIFLAIPPTNRPMLNVDTIVSNQLPFEVMPAAMQKIISMFPLTQGIQLMKATFLGLPIENVLLPVGFMGAVIFICFGISVKCFKWE